MLGFPRAEQQIPAGNRAEGERLPLCSTEPGGALPALRCSCCLWEPLTFVVPPHPALPTVPCSFGSLLLGVTEVLQALGDARLQ